MSDEIRGAKTLAELKTGELYDTDITIAGDKNTTKGVPLKQLKEYLLKEIKAELQGHDTNTEKHVTTAEKANWNGYKDSISDLNSNLAEYPNGIRIQDINWKPTDLGLANGKQAFISINANVTSVLTGGELPHDLKGMVINWENAYYDFMMRVGNGNANCNLRYAISEDSYSWHLFKASESGNYPPL